MLTITVPSPPISFQQCHHWQCFTRKWLLDKTIKGFVSCIGSLLISVCKKRALIIDVSESSCSNSSKTSSLTYLKFQVAINSLWPGIEYATKKLINLIRVSLNPVIPKCKKGIKFVLSQKINSKITENWVLVYSIKGVSWEIANFRRLGDFEEFDSNPRIGCLQVRRSQQLLLVFDIICYSKSEIFNNNCFIFPYFLNQDLQWHLFCLRNNSSC